jgi:ABC-type Fe3+ transport system substrate-binding protein
MTHLISRFALGFVIILCSSSVLADSLSIISPHRKSLQNEFIPRFVEHYKKTYGQDIKVEWIDQGGTSNNVKFIRSKYANNAKTSGLDVFWGGPSVNFIEMANANVLAPYKLSPELKKQLKPKAAGNDISDANNLWHASAISSFGILYNNALAKKFKLPVPQTWQDLGRYEYYDQLSIADPRHSGTNATMNLVMLQAYGYEKAWATFVSLGGNTRTYTHSSSDPLKHVESGEALASTVIDFYGFAKVNEHGKDKINLVIPEGQSIIDTDPIAMLKGAPNTKEAGRFIEYILSAEAQRVLITKKGSPHGPKSETFARMAMNPAAYNHVAASDVVCPNPFELKPMMNFDYNKAAKISRQLNDLIGATIIDTHKDLKKAWKQVVTTRSKSLEQKLTAPFISEAELLAIQSKWSDDVFRNKTINEWVAKAQARYKDVASSSH